MDSTKKGTPLARKITKGFTPTHSNSESSITTTPVEEQSVKMARVSSQDPHADIKHTLKILSQQKETLNDPLKDIGHRNSLVIPSHSFSPPSKAAGLPTGSPKYTRRQSGQFVVGSIVKPSFEDHLFDQGNTSYKDLRQRATALPQTMASNITFDKSTKHIPQRPSPQHSSPQQKTASPSNQSEQLPPSTHAANESSFKKPTTKAERRELQERQRAEKAARIQQAGGTTEKKGHKKQKSIGGTTSLGIGSSSKNSSFQDILSGTQNKSGAGSRKGSKRNSDGGKSINFRQCTLLSHLEPYHKDYQFIYDARDQGLIHPAVISFGRDVLERKIVTLLSILT